MDPANYGYAKFRENNELQIVSNIGTEEPRCGTTRRTKHIILGVIGLAFVASVAVGVFVGIYKLRDDGITAFPRPSLPIPPPTPYPGKSAFGAYRYAAVSTDTILCSKVGT